MEEEEAAVAVAVETLPVTEMDRAVAEENVTAEAAEAVLAAEVAVHG